MGRYLKPGFWRSLNQAWRGMLYTLKTQGHMQFHVFAGILVLSVAWWAKVSRFEWLILVLAIGSVIGAEVMNSAVEIVVDMVQPNFHPLAGMAKDVASGAVLVTSIQAIIIGLIVFAPLLYRSVGKVF
ncbi:diacylglycerol kinase family protein [Desulfosporosinus sp. BICA1-9]|uniref:diacylglycerol kinase family protein n=1 Tax=Desulfosporosinus sp. BICA1-9 TaxID=1531958 RepID=UPI00054BDCB6|nr:diacylglycerol kinase family protein [Desulfosporosinus sp. BICA1-9]KJS47516.1 MAG: diacylglycerol kinase [Peptococcaceae bacterium BRH_c23]KJS86824.1 MAG: diacylglycerol kinase [Desulfosporosinus sp. BICA1-9]KJS87259.1 MAG: diacylglycerol kinase [Desulfosporosinus sp. BICA1-9]HBW34958.1 diacylglycerol kinase family protein [Desulfosporosinus sp.]